jgi:hypothetical protein
MGGQRPADAERGCGLVSTDRIRLRGDMQVQAASDRVGKGRQISDGSGRGVTEHGRPFYR